MKYRIVMELEFDNTVDAEAIEHQIEYHLRPMVEDTKERNFTSPLTAGTLTYEEVVTQ